MPYPDALKSNPKCIFFTDFDGTITLQDSRSAVMCLCNPSSPRLMDYLQAMITWYLILEYSFYKWF